MNPVDPNNAPDSYEIKFTDVNFKRALNSVLMKTETSRNLDSPITVGEAKKMTTFWPDNPYRNFENLEGIQYFTNLETIHIAGISSLKDISAASALTKIKTAYLSSLNISDMSATKNWKQVRLIWIHDTHVTDFSFLSELPYAGVWGIRSNIVIKVQKADNPTFEEIKKAEENLKSAIEKAKRAESEHQKSSEDRLKEVEKIVEDNKTNKNEFPAVDIENIENLISKVKDEKRTPRIKRKIARN